MNLRHLMYKFFYALWFIIIPLAVSWVVVGILDRARLVDEFEPWYVLLLFAILVIVIYSAKNKLPLWKDPNENSDYNRNLRSELARTLQSRVRKILDKKGFKVSEKGKKELGATLNDLDSAIEQKKHDQVPKLIQQLEAKTDTYLAFAKKPMWREYFESIGVAIIIAVLLRLFTLEAFKIPSESMVPTLMVGDHIFVNKYLYGISMPFQNKRLVKFAKPDYGEVIVFVKPSRAEQGAPQDIEPEEMIGTDFIKRIVAIEGDEVKMKDDVLFINGKELPRCKIGTKKYRSYNRLRNEWVDDTGELWLERNGDNLYTIIEDNYPYSFEPRIIPEGQVFVLGDNRDNSNDSRYWGSVPFDNIKGRAMLIWWSNKRPHGFQLDRVGNLIMGSPNLTQEQQISFDQCESMLKD